MFNWFKKTKKSQVKKKYDENTNSLLVKKVDDSDDDLLKGIGMSEERASELRGEVSKQFEMQTDLVDVMVECSKSCTHANELFYVSLSAAYKMRERMQKNILMEILGKKEP